MTKSLEDYLNEIKNINNNVIDTNCFDGQYNVLEGLQAIQSKINEVIDDINQGLLKGEKGDTPNINVGNTNTIPSNQSANVIERGDDLNKVLDFYIPQGIKGDKGDKGDPGNATINDNIQSRDYTWSSNRIIDEFIDFKNNIEDLQGLDYETENNFMSINGSKNGVITDIKIEGKTLLVDSNNQVVIPGTQGAMLKSVGDDVTEIKLKSIGENLFDGELELGIYNGNTGYPMTNNNFIRNKNRYINVNSEIITMVTNFSLEIYCYGINKNYLGQIRLNSTNNNFNLKSGTKFINFRSTNENTNLKSEFTIINRNTNINSFLEYKENNKKVLYKDTDGTWKKPTLRQFDSIEKHSDGKYYYHKRSTEFTIDNNIAISSLEILNNTNKVQFNTRMYKLTSNVGTIDWICDKYPSLQGSDDILHCRLDSSMPYGNFIVWLDKSYGNDKNTILNNLLIKPIKVVSKLKEEQIFECTPLDLISYDSQTNYNIDCGVIYPKSTIYISSDYGSVLSNIVRRMTERENDYIEDRKAIIRGDFRLLAEKTYPTDFKKESEEIINEYR